MTVNRVVEFLVITVYGYRESSPGGGDRTEIPIQARAQRGIGMLPSAESGTPSYPDAEMFDVDVLGPLHRDIVDVDVLFFCLYCSYYAHSHV